METKVRLCDMCKKMVMEAKCDTCECDLCNNCSIKDYVSFINIPITRIVSCRVCREKIISVRDKLEECVPKDFKSEFITSIKKNLIVEFLK